MEQLVKLAVPAAGPLPVIAAGTGLAIGCAPANLSHILQRVTRTVIALNHSLGLHLVQQNNIIQSASERRTYPLLAT